MFDKLYSSSRSSTVRELGGTECGMRGIDMGAAFVESLPCMPAGDPVRISVQGSCLEQTLGALEQCFGSFEAVVPRRCYHGKELFRGDEGG